MDQKPEKVLFCPYSTEVNPGEAGDQYRVWESPGEDTIWTPANTEPTN